MTIRSKLILLLALFGTILSAIFIATLLVSHDVKNRLSAVDACLDHIEIASKINEGIFDQLEYSFKYLIWGNERDLKLTKSSIETINVLLEEWSEEEKVHAHVLHTERPVQIKKDYDQIVKDLENSFLIRQKENKDAAISYYSHSVENNFENLIFKEFAKVNREELSTIKVAYDILLFKTGILPWLDEKIVQQVNHAKWSIGYFIEISELSSHINKLHKDGFDYILNDSVAKYDDFKKDHERTLRSITNLRKSMAGYDNTVEDDIKDIYDSYLSAADLFHESFEYHNSGDSKRAFSLLKNEIEPLIHNKIILILEKLSKHSFGEIEEAHNQLKETVSSTVGGISIAIVILLFSTLYIFIKLIIEIMESLSSLKKGINMIGEGNLEYEINMVEKDELGELAGVVNNMSKQLRNTTVSRNLLLEEVEERKKTEINLIAAKEELVEANEELAILNEEMEATNEELLNEIEERQKLEEYLIAAKENAETATRAKSQFLANMSHDLRTPLNAIIGFSEVLSMGAVGDLEGRQKDCVMDILESGHHLLSLINQILDLSRIEAGKFELNYSEVPVHDLIESTLIFIREKASNKNIDLLTEFSHDDLCIETDRLRLKQVLINLLGNAVKFTPNNGKISVKTKTCSQSEKITISIEDTGMGIKDEDIGKIFNAFEQVDSSYTKENEGSGLGLALSRRIVELMGGKIWVESQLGKGSCFSFYIPSNQKGESKDQFAGKELNIQKLSRGYNS